MLTMTDLINRKISLAGKMSQGDIVKYILQEDMASPQKERMRAGARYYAGEHDSLQKRYDQGFVEENEQDNGVEKQVRRSFCNPNRSNHHNIDPFHRVLVDQKVAYMVGRPPTVSVAGAQEDETLGKYEKMIGAAVNEQFHETLQDWVCGASNKGFEALHIYYDAQGELQYCIVPAEEIIPIYDSQFQKELVGLIRYYTVTVVRNGQRYLRRKVEWWTKQDVTYYVEREQDVFLPDPDFLQNPAPHWWDVQLLNGMEKARKPHGWGRIPFILLQNNRDMTTDLQPIKGLIDAYDMISSEGVNTLLDLVDLYWVIQGYGGETAAAIARKLQINKAVSISDSEGSVTAQQVELSLQGRIDYLRMLRRDIYHFGMGLGTDFEDETFGSAPSGVALQFRYAGLSYKADNMAVRLKRAIKEFFWFLTDDYNRRNGTNFESGRIRVSLNYSRIANDAETVEMIMQSRGLVSDKTLLIHHPYVEDVNEELKTRELEQETGQDGEPV